MLQLIRLHGEMLVSIWYRASVDNTLEENSSVFSLNRMHWLPSARACGSKTLHQQNLLVLYWKCWLTQVDCIMAVKWLLLLLLLRYLLVDVTVFLLHCVHFRKMLWLQSACTVSVSQTAETPSNTLSILYLLPNL